MKKVVINNCFGGYGLSANGLIEVLKAKGYDENSLYIYKEMPYDMEKELGYKWGYMRANKDENLYMLWGISTEDYGDTFDKTYNQKLFGKYSFERTDTELIACIEKFGSEFMSSDCASLYIDEYDEENFDYYIDEYEGSETLCTTPVVSEKRLREMKNVDDIMDYLESIYIKVRRKEI